MRSILREGVRHEDLSEADIAAHLYAPELPDPDLVIRTSGEQRISNFLLWQSAYAELVFDDTLWPDFGEERLRSALEEYASRARRFGAR
jgi:undecaprenyl diphosphate synthase